MGLSNRKVYDVILMMHKWVLDSSIQRVLVASARCHGIPYILFKIGFSLGWVRSQSQKPKHCILNEIIQYHNIIVNLCLPNNTIKSFHLISLSHVYYKYTYIYTYICYLVLNKIQAWTPILYHKTYKRDHQISWSRSQTSTARRSGKRSTNWSKASKRCDGRQAFNNIRLLHRLYHHPNNHNNHNHNHKNNNKQNNSHNTPSSSLLCLVQT